MPVWTVAGVCAVVAAALAYAAPTVVRRLPLPVGSGREDTGTTAVVGVTTMSYTTIANARWFLPGGVIVSGTAAGALGLAFGADWLLWFLGSGLGFGDVRLAALVGMVTARVGWEPFVFGIYGALLLALGYALAQSAVTRRSLRGVGIPLGPFLVIGAAAGLLVGAGGCSPT